MLIGQFMNRKLPEFLVSFYIPTFICIFRKTAMTPFGNELLMCNATKRRLLITDWFVLMLFHLRRFDLWRKIRIVGG
jgi:hypothetical protein